MTLTDYLTARYGRDQMLAWADDAKEEELDKEEDEDDE
jgi:hypothetical protein